MIFITKSRSGLNLSYSIYTILWVTLIAILFTGCQVDPKKNIPKVSNIEIDVELRRFEQDLFALDTTQIASALEELEAKYPEFSLIFFDQIMGSTDPRIAPEGHPAYIKGFLNHPPVQKLYDTCMVVYPNLKSVEEEFQQAFQFLKYYFPDQPTPKVTTFISEYSLAGFIYGEGDLAVGLDLFLGASYPYMQYNPANPAFSDYLTRSFTKEHLVSKTLQPLVEDLMGEPYGNRLLDMMIFNGKKLYLLDLLLPHTPDSVKLEISQQQVEWLAKNEREIYSYFLQENLLYSSDTRAIRKYVDYSPNSPGMPPEAPGGTANWLGLQIVKKYVEQFPEANIGELLELRDAQALLTRSRYKPNR